MNTSELLRRRFEAHESKRGLPEVVMAADPENPAGYADPTTQRHWALWRAAQPGALELTSARAYLETLKTRAVFSKDRTAILKAAQHLMRCVRNDNPEYF
jgi:hypothetical protein